MEARGGFTYLCSQACFELNSTFTYFAVCPRAQVALARACQVSAPHSQHAIVHQHGAMTDLCDTFVGTWSCGHVRRVALHVHKKQAVFRKWFSFIETLTAEEFRGYLRFPDARELVLLRCFSGVVNVAQWCVCTDASPLAAARDRRLVSSPAVLADGIVKLGLLHLVFPMSCSRCVLVHSVCEKSTWLVHPGSKRPSCQQRDQELDSSPVWPQAHRLLGGRFPPCCF